MYTSNICILQIFWNTRPTWHSSKEVQKLKNRLKRKNSPPIVDGLYTNVHIQICIYMRVYVSLYIWILIYNGTPRVVNDHQMYVDHQIHVKYIYVYVYRKMYICINIKIYSMFNVYIYIYIYHIHVYNIYTCTNDMCIYIYTGSLPEVRRSLHDCLYIFTYIYICMYVYIYIENLYTHKNNMYIYMYIGLLPEVDRWSHVCLYIYTYICMFICIYILIIYIHIQIICKLYIHRIFVCHWQIITCMFIYLYIYMYVCIYIYIVTSIQPNHIWCISYRETNR